MSCNEFEKQEDQFDVVGKQGTTQMLGVQLAGLESIPKSPLNNIGDK